MKSIGTIFLLWNTFVALSQTVADFENFELLSESFLNGSEAEGGFESGNVFLPNDYNSDFDSWSGWAISNTTDTTTPGFFNQYSAVSGSGVHSSANYAVTYIFGESIIKLKDEAAGQPVMGFYVTNSTYAYLSMLEGDAFSKKFGGVTGDDPDFFLLTIRKYYNGELSSDSIAFYLADFRFENNAEDYIISDWTFVDLSSLGSSDSLSFVLTSSDVGQFGMNTPAYFCADNIITKDGVSTSVVSQTTAANFEIYPNPASDFVAINKLFNQGATYQIYDMFGRVIYRGRISRENHLVDIQTLVKGRYILQVFTEGRRVSRFFIKE